MASTQFEIACKWQAEDTIQPIGGEHGVNATGKMATASETDNRVSIFDSFLPGGNEAPWHYHEIDDEIFYIVSGEVEFGVAEEVFIASAGDLVIAGPDVPRRFNAVVDSHMVIINAPAGPSEGFIRDIAQFRDGAVPSDEDRQRFIDEYKIHII